MVPFNEKKKKETKKHIINIYIYKISFKVKRHHRHTIQNNEWDGRIWTLMKVGGPFGKFGKIWDGYGIFQRTTVLKWSKRAAKSKLAFAFAFRVWVFRNFAEAPFHFIAYILNLLAVLQLISSDSSQFLSVSYWNSCLISFYTVIRRFWCRFSHFYFSFKALSSNFCFYFLLMFDSVWFPRMRGYESSWCV